MMYAVIMVAFNFILINKKKSLSFLFDKALIVIRALSYLYGKLNPFTDASTSN